MRLETIQRIFIRLEADRNKTTPVVWVFALVAVLAVSCGPAMQVFQHQEADMSYYTSVGVVPFISLGADKFAGEKFSIEFTTALLVDGDFEVLDYGVFTDVVARVVGSRAPARGLTVEELKKIAEAAGVQGVFEGTVKQYEMVSTSGGSYPVISVEARLLDAETGTVVWMATATEKGGPKTPIIGIGETRTLGELAQKLSKKLVSRIE